MKIGVGLVLLVALILIPSIEAATLESCSFKRSCSQDEIAIGSAFQKTDSHVSKDLDAGNYQICCKGESLGASCEVGQKQDYLGFLYTSDSHIDSQVQSEGLCLSTNDGSEVDCRIIDGRCGMLGACVFEMYQETDSHVAECGAISGLPYSMCCSVKPVKTCFGQGEGRTDGDGLQCCATAPTGEELYYFNWIIEFISNP